MTGAHVIESSPSHQIDGESQSAFICFEQDVYFKEERVGKILPGNPHYHSEVILPYDGTSEVIGQGASGRVYKLKIKAAHLKTGTSKNTEPVNKVRKEFRGSKAHDNFIKENNFLRTLLGRPTKHGNIMTPSFSYAVGDPPVYNIVFESALYSLSAFFSGASNFPNGVAAERLKNVDRMIGVAGGLQWLSESFERSPTSGNYEEAYSYHRDLRPENILVCEEWHSGIRDLVFKISDFGRALQKPKHPESERRSSLANPSSPHDAVGGTYAAPEALRTEKSDVWSFGCVLLVVMLFNYEGIAGLNEFMASLLRESKIDRFYDMKTRKVNPETTSCIVYLRSRSEAESDKLVTQHLLQLLSDHILVPEKSRWDMDKIERNMKEADSQKDLITSTVRNRTSPAIKKGARHCAQSPRGNFEVFQVPGDEYKLVVYHNDLCTALQLLEPISAPRQGERKSSHRVYPYSESCGTGSISQVISNQDPIELLLYHIPDRTGIPVAREFISLTDIQHISYLALAPNTTEKKSVTLAIDAIIGQDKSSSALRLFNIEYLTEQMSRIREVPSRGIMPEGISFEGISSMYHDLLKGKQMGRSYERETVALCFSGNGQRLYHITKARSAEHRMSLDCQVEVALWNVGDIHDVKHVANSRITKRDLETKEFITCFAPFHEKPGFIIITCRRYIYNYHFVPGATDENLTEYQDEEINDVLKRVVLAPDDSFCVFLGGEERLSIYVVKLAGTESWERKKFKVDQAQDFVYEPERDAATITSDRKLLISYRQSRAGNSRSGTLASTFLLKHEQHYCLDFEAPKGPTTGTYFFRH